MHNQKYNFKAKVWLYSSKKSAWHFVTLATEMAEDLNNMYSDLKRGFGSLPVRVTIGNVIWKTSIFPDKRSKSFLLPIKASIRENLKIKNQDTIHLIIKILL